MDRFFRFSDYDIWAYLSAGVLAIAAWDFAFEASYVLKTNWTVPEGVVLIFAAYVVGQILATPSSWILERLITAKVLKSPSVNLFAVDLKGFRAFLKAVVLPDYYNPLVRKIREPVLEKAGPGVDPGEELFWTAYAIAKRDETAAPRMAQFLNIYGFCRNISFVALLACAFNLFEIWHLPKDAARVEELWIWTGISAAVALLMFHRFLKFYRLYSVEVFVSYSGN